FELLVRLRNSFAARFHLKWGIGVFITGVTNADRSLADLWERASTRSRSPRFQKRALRRLAYGRRRHRNLPTHRSPRLAHRRRERTERRKRRSLLGAGRRR